MKLGVHRAADSGTYALRPSPATRLHLRHIRAFGVPCAGDKHGPYVRFTLCEVDPIARQPSARTEALSHADQCDPVWHDDLRLMLPAGTVRPPLVRVEVRQRVRRSAGWQALAKTLPSSGPTLWSDRAAASASCSDSGEAAQQADALLGAASVRLAAAGRSKVVELQLAGEGKLDPIEDDGLSIQLKLDAIEAQAPKALLATPQRRCGSGSGSASGLGVK